MGKDAGITPNQRLLELIRKPAAAAAASVGATARPVEAVAAGRRGLLAGLLPRGKAACVGVDISQTHLVCVKIRGRDAAFELLGKAVVPVPEGVAPGSPEFVALLRQTLSGLCGADPLPHLWAAVQSSRANLQFVTIPKVPSRQVNNAVFWTAKKELGFDEASVVFDFEPRGEVAEKGATKIGAMAYTAPRDAVNVVRGDFVKAGFPLAGLTLEPFSHQNLFRRKLVSGVGVATANLHVGANWSRLEIFSNGNLMFVRVIKTSMAGMIQAVQEALDAYRHSSPQAAASPGEAQPEAEPPTAGDAPGEAGFSLSPELSGPMLLDLDNNDVPGGLVLDLDAGPGATPEPEPAQASPSRPLVSTEQAREAFEGILYGCGGLPDDHPGAGLGPDEIMSMLEPVASRLVRQVEMTLKHYRESLGYDAVTGLTVSGPLGASDAFVRYIGEQTGLPCAALDPMGDRVPAVCAPGGRDAPGPAWTQALGLAFSEQAITPNALFTYVAKAAQRASRLVEQWSLVGLAMVLSAMAYYSFDASARVRALTGEREAITRELAVLGAAADPGGLARMTAELRAKRESLRAFAARNKAVGFFEQALALAPDGVALGSVTGEFGPPPATAKVGAPQPAQQTPGRLVIEGMVTGDARLFDSALASYVVALEGSPLFDGVSVKKSELEALEGGASGLRFVIGCSFAGD